MLNHRCSERQKWHELLAEVFDLVHDHDGDCVCQRLGHPNNGRIIILKCCDKHSHDPHRPSNRLLYCEPRMPVISCNPYLLMPIHISVCGRTHVIIHAQQARGRSWPEAAIEYRGVHGYLGQTFGWFELACELRCSEAGPNNMSELPKEHFRIIPNIQRTFQKNLSKEHFKKNLLNVVFFQFSGLIIPRMPILGIINSEN